MAKPDGRIEKGQRLSTAISARAWNRAQDAADIVLGVRPGLEAGMPAPFQYALVVPVRLTSAPSIAYEYVGVPIEISECEIYGTGSNPAGVNFIGGAIAEPQDLRTTTALPAPKMFAVTVEPMQTGASVVRCAIRGVCVARVRRFAATDRYVALPTRRAAAETVDSLRGTLESSTAGHGRLIAAINDDFSLISI
jgi:hypothetical protein